MKRNLFGLILCMILLASCSSQNQKTTNTSNNFKVSIEWGHQIIAVRERIILTKEEIAYSKYLNVSSKLDRGYFQKKYPNFLKDPLIFKAHTIQIEALLKNLNETDFFSHKPINNETGFARYTGIIREDGKGVIRTSNTVDGWTIKISISTGGMKNEVELWNGCLPSFVVILKSISRINPEIASRLKTPLDWMKESMASACKIDNASVKNINNKTSGKTYVRPGKSPTEKAVLSGEKWLASQQLPDGHWSGNNTEKNNNDLDITATALAVYALLNTGNTSSSGKYKSNVSKGLEWLYQNIRDDGLWSNDQKINAIALTALGAGYVTTLRDKRLKKAVKRSLELLAGYQLENGAWSKFINDKKPDIEVTCWVLTAFKTGVGSVFPRYKNFSEIYKKSLNYFENLKTDNDLHKTSAMLYGMIIAGKDIKSSVLKKYADYLIKHSPDPKSKRYTSWYFQSRAFFKLYSRYDHWWIYMKRLYKLLREIQEKDGQGKGSWPIEDIPSGLGCGKVGSTSLSLLLFAPSYCGWYSGHRNLK